MARRKVIDLNAESTIEWEKPGQMLEGYYIGFKTVTSEYGPSKLHVFQTPDGTVGCWGSAQLDSKLGSIEKGAMIFVTFNGKAKLKGGKTIKNFDVEYDDEDKLDVSNVAMNYARDAENSDSDDTEVSASDTQDTDPDDTTADDDDADTIPNPAQENNRRGAAVPPTMAQKSKAQEALNRFNAKKNGKAAA